MFVHFVSFLSYCFNSLHDMLKSTYLLTYLLKCGCVVFELREWTDKHLSYRQVLGRFGPVILMFDHVLNLSRL